MNSTFFDKINVVDIICNHADTLVDSTTGRRRFGDFVLFYAVPGVVMGGFLFFGVRLSDTTLAVFATSFSVLAGLLFNLLVLLHTIQMPTTGFDVVDRAVDRLKRELHANIAYAIVVALIGLVPLVIAANYPIVHWGRAAFGCVTVYLEVHFVLTMGMVLKRMHTMLEHRLSK